MADPERPEPASVDQRKETSHPPLLIAARKIRSMLGLQVVPPPAHSHVAAAFVVHEIYGLTQLLTRLHTTLQMLRHASKRSGQSRFRLHQPERSFATVKDTWCPKANSLTRVGRSTPCQARQCRQAISPIFGENNAQRKCLGISDRCLSRFRKCQSVQERAF